MKTILSISILGLSLLSQAQETHNISWRIGVPDSEASLTISVGDKIIWTWADSHPHDVFSVDTDAPDDFGSEVLEGAGNTYEYTFTDPASIDYFCSIHESTMNGTITVLPTMSVEDKFIKNFKYYPSVVKESLTLASLVPVENYEIYDTQGRKVAQGKFTNTNHYVINTSSLSSGVYIVNVVAANNLKTTFKVVKE